MKKRNGLRTVALLLGVIALAPQAVFSGTNSANAGSTSRVLQWRYDGLSPARHTQKPAMAS